MGQKQKTQLGKIQNFQARQSAAKPKLKRKEYEEQIAKGNKMHAISETGH